MNIEAAKIVTAVGYFIRDFETQDAIYIVKWVIDSGDVHVMLHAIAEALVSSTDRVAHAIQDAINDSPLPPFDLVGMVKTLRNHNPQKRKCCAGDERETSRQRMV
jgi:hypothetical protein